MTITEICDVLKKELLDNGYEYGFASADTSGFEKSITIGEKNSQFTNMTLVLSLFIRCVENTCFCLTSANFFEK